MPPPGASSPAHTNNTVTQVINQATLTPSITANGKTYDGGTTVTLASQTVATTFGSDVVSLEVGASSFTSNSAGTETVTATGLSLGGSSAANYTLSSTTASTTAVIAQASAHASVAAIAGLVYSGAAQTTAAGTATDVFGHALAGSDFTLTGTVHTNAGTYVGDAWSFSDPSGNYASQSGTVTDSIGQANAHASVTATAGLVYNGSADHGGGHGHERLRRCVAGQRFHPHGHGAHQRRDVRRRRLVVLRPQRQLCQPERHGDRQHRPGQRPRQRDGDRGPGLQRQRADHGGGHGHERLRRYACRAAISRSRARCTPTPGRTSPTPGRSPTPAATMPARAAR